MKTLPTVALLSSVALSVALFANQKEDKSLIASSDVPLKQAVIDGTGQGWRPLGGEDFVNVNCEPDTWTWKDGVAYCTGKPVGVIRMKEPIKNFELVCEWKHKQHGGNSGVFVWASQESIDQLAAGKGRLPHGIEVQVLDLGYARKIRRAAQETLPTGSPPTATSSLPARQDESVPTGRPEWQAQLP